MDQQKTKSKLKVLDQTDLDTLLILVQEEYKNRGLAKGNEALPRFTTNRSNTPSQISNSLHNFFENAWIHG